MFGIGGWELLVIAVVALIVLGPKGLPSAARAIGRVASQLRRATQDLRDTIELDPELSELPKAIDEINRPLLSNPLSYRKKPTPKDQPEESAAERPPPVDFGPASEVERNKPSVEEHESEEHEPEEHSEGEIEAAPEAASTETRTDTEEVGGDG